MELNENQVKLIAFFLPQYHPIPENDEWWGKGFTEWRNVAKAYPNFEKHYQPHLPADLGYYDLRIPEVREQQAELAKQYGIYGFCYHHYWFGGKRLLERPFNEILASGKPDFPFCLCWANENWTRRWDGADKQILISQKHSPEDDLAFIRDIMPALKDPRYIRVNDRPVLIVYRINLLPNPVQTAYIWRDEAIRNGLKDLYLVVAQSFGIGDPKPYGFDAAVEFPPHNAKGLWLNDQVKITNPDFNGHIFDYDKVVKNHISQDLSQAMKYRLFRTVMPSWDNTARRQNNGHVFHNATPEKYRFWLRTAVEHAQKSHPEGERFVFINAWNEWAEGCHLEPDMKNGMAYLRATAEALKHDRENGETKSFRIKSFTDKPIDARELETRYLKFLLYSGTESGVVDEIIKKETLVKYGVFGHIFPVCPESKDQLFEKLRDHHFNRPFCVALDMQKLPAEFSEETAIQTSDWLFALFSSHNYILRANRPVLVIRNAGLNASSPAYIAQFRKQIENQGDSGLFVCWGLENEFSSGLILEIQPEQPDQPVQHVINHAFYPSFDAILDIHPGYTASVVARNQFRLTRRDTSQKKWLSTIPHVPQRHDTHFRGWFVPDQVISEWGLKIFAKQLWQTVTQPNQEGDFFVISASDASEASLITCLNQLKDMIRLDPGELSDIFASPDDRLYVAEDTDSNEDENSGKVAIVAYYPEGANTYNKAGMFLRRIYAWSNRKGIKFIPAFFHFTGRVLFRIGFRKLGQDFLNMKRFV
jgi:hypothetical protein